MCLVSWQWFEFHTETQSLKWAHAQEISVLSQVLPQTLNQIALVLLALAKSSFHTFLESLEMVVHFYLCNTDGSLKGTTPGRHHGVRNPGTVILLP